MYAKSLLAIFALVLLAYYAKADYDVVQYCPLLPTDTKLPSLSSCETYYTCVSSNQVQAANCTDNTIFDKDSQSCVPASSGSCSSINSNPCLNKDKIWVADTNTCGMWHYCSNGTILGSGLCPNKEIFNETAQLCVYGECATHTEAGVIVIENMCTIMPTAQFFGDFNNCTTWHICHGMSMESGSCPSGLVYDRNNRICTYNNGNICNGPPSTCTAAQNGSLTADSSTCSVYYQCVQQNSVWLWQREQCPYGQYFDVRMQGCNNRQAAIPTPTCDRCEFATTSWVNAVDSTCTEYLTCSNGREIANGTCSAPNTYFDETHQICSEGSGDLPNYRLNNGACALPINATTTTTVLPPITDPASYTNASTIILPSNTTVNITTTTTTSTTTTVPTTTNNSTAASSNTTAMA